ncbi:MAG TPA: PD-(D/E)XK nuclease family protein [Planctomycetota bacterium]
MPLSVHTHPRTEVLEEAFLAELRRIRGSDPLAPVWIITPTRRLGRALQRRLAEAGGAVLGVEFLELLGFAQRIAARLPVRENAALRSVAERLLVRHALADCGETRLLAFDGAESSLVPAFRALREGGVDGARAVDAARAVETAAPPPLVLRVFAAWRERVEAAQLDDDYALPARIESALAAGAPGLPHVVLFGFSELVGRWRRMVAALARVHPVVLFAHAPGAEAAVGLEASGAMLGDLCRLAGAGPKAIRRLPGAATVPSALLAHLARRGPAGELEEAFRQARRWHREGLPLARIGIVARTLEPYAPWLRPTAARLGMESVLDASVGSPLARHPAAAGLRRALGRRVAADDAFGQALDSCGSDEVVAGALRKAWAAARQAMLVRRPGDPEFPVLLAQALDAQSLPIGGGNGLAVLDAQQARGLRFARTVLLGFHQGGWPLPPREDPWLDETRRAQLQALGCTATELPDRAAARADEHLLLQLALRTAEDGLLVLRQHADQAGSRVAASTALDALRRHLGAAADLGKPSIASADPLAKAARHVGEGCADPGTAAAALAVGGPAAARAQQLADRQELVAARLGPAPGWIGVVDAREPGAMRFDGVVPPREDFALLREPVGPTRLEAYGRGPLGYFFEKLLAVPPRETRRLPGPPALDLGTAVHAVLETAWNSAAGADPRPLLAATAAAFEDFVAPLFARAQRTDEREAARYLERECTRWRGFLQAFVGWDHARVVGGLKDRSVGHAPMRLDTLETERELAAELELSGMRAPFAGKADRILRDGSGEGRVTDWKTGKSADASKLTPLLQGERAQLALYLLVAEAAGMGLNAAEAIGVNPDFDYTESASVGKWASALRPDQWAAAREGLLETVAVLFTHCRRGHFCATRKPGDRSEHGPKWDGWFATQRIGHDPTLDRIAAFEPWQDLLALHQKTSGRKKDCSDGRLMLADVRAYQAGEQAEEAALP